MPIVVVMKNPRFEEFLSTSRDQDLGAQLVFPSIQKRQLASSFKGARSISNSAAKDFDVATSRGISRAVT